MRPILARDWPFSDLNGRGGFCSFRWLAVSAQRMGRAEHEPMLIRRRRCDTPVVAVAFQDFTRRMSVCYASSIVFDGASISWFGPAGATWNVPVAQLRALGEYTTDAVEHWLVTFVVDTSGAWLQAPVNASGMSTVLKALGPVLNAQLELRLELAKPGSTRVFWPPQCGSMPLFAHGAFGRALHPQLIESLTYTNLTGR